MGYEDAAPAADAAQAGGLAPLGYVETARSLSGFGEGSGRRVVEELLPLMRSLGSMQLEITTWCNPRCSECSRTKSIAADVWRSVHMPFDRYERIIAKLPPAEWIFLQEVG